MQDLGKPSSQATTLSPSLTHSLPHPQLLSSVPLEAHRTPPASGSLSHSPSRILPSLLPHRGHPASTWTQTDMRVPEVTPSLLPAPPPFFGQPCSARDRFFMAISSPPYQRSPPLWMPDVFQAIMASRSSQNACRQPACQSYSPPGF